jgi:hypothetical protein
MSSACQPGPCVAIYECRDPRNPFMLLAADCRCFPQLSQFPLARMPAWTDWAAQHGISETMAAALYLVSRNRKADEVVVKLTPSEVERVIDIVYRWPDHLPPGALAALKNSRPTSSLEPSAAGGSPGAAPTRGNARPTRAYGPAGFRAEVTQRATEHATTCRCWPAVDLRRRLAACRACFLCRHSCAGFQRPVPRSAPSATS